jgi:hypothetical protein
VVEMVCNIVKGKSAFSPDRNHLHHLALDVFKLHYKSTISILCLVVAGALASTCATIGLTSLLLLQFAFPLLVSFSLSKIKQFSFKNLVPAN